MTRRNEAEAHTEANDGKPLSKLSRYERMVRCLSHYQYVLHKSTKNFVENANASQQTLLTVRTLWFDYLKQWKRRGIELPSIFSHTTNNKRNYYTEHNELIKGYQTQFCEQEESDDDEMDIGDTLHIETIPVDNDNESMETDGGVKR